MVSIKKGLRRSALLTVLVRLGFQCAAIAWGIVPAWAMHPLITDDTGTQGHGGRQLELGGEWGHSAAEHRAESAATFSYGVTESVDAVINLPFQLVHERREEGPAPMLAGPADAAMEVKWRCVEGEGWSLGIRPGLTLTTGDSERGFGAGRSAYRIIALASAVRGRTEFLANAGYVRNENVVGERPDLWHGSLAAVLRLSGRLKLAVNTAWDSDRVPASSATPASFVAGAVAGLGENLDIDLGWRTGLNKARSGDALLAGMAWRF